LNTLQNARARGTKNQIMVNKRKCEKKLLAGNGLAENPEKEPEGSKKRPFSRTERRKPLQNDDKKGEKAEGTNRERFWCLHMGVKTQKEKREGKKGGAARIVKKASAGGVPVGEPVEE